MALLPQPGRLEENCPNTTFCDIKKLILLSKGTNKFQKFEGCFLRGQVSLNGFKIFNGLTAEP